MTALVLRNVGFDAMAPPAPLLSDKYLHNNGGSQKNGRNRSAGLHFILPLHRGRARGPYSEIELARLNRLVEGFSHTCSFALRLKSTASQRQLLWG